jgi:hypothetical protein
MPAAQCPTQFRRAFLGEPARVTIEHGERLYKGEG